MDTSTPSYVVLDEQAFVSDANVPVAFVRYHHVLMAGTVASWIVSALLLAGCTSSTGAINNIYLLSITYNSRSDSNASATSLFGNASMGGQISVRAGYLGLCAKAEDQDPWVCASGASGLGLNLATSGPSRDPLDAIGWADRFKSDVVFPGLVFGAMVLSALAFLGMATFPSWHEEHDPVTGSDIDIKPFPSRRVSMGCAFMLCIASLFLLTSALWQHVAAATAASIISSGTQEYLSGHVGPAAAILVWLAMALVVIVCVGLVNMILQIRLLDRLTDD